MCQRMLHETMSAHANEKKKSLLTNISNRSQMLLALRCDTTYNTARTHLRRMFRFVCRARSMSLPFATSVDKHLSSQTHNKFVNIRPLMCIVMKIFDFNETLNSICKHRALPTLSSVAQREWKFGACYTEQFVF